MPWGRSGTDFPAPRLLALVDVLFQPSLDGLTTVPHVTAHSVANWAVALVPPAVQGVNGNAQHFRDVRKRPQLVTGLECHDHRPFVDGQSGGHFRRAESALRPGRSLRTARRLRTGDRQRPK